MRRTVDKLAILLPDGTKEPLTYMTVVKHRLQAGMKAPFSGFPIVVSGTTELRYDKELKDWQPVILEKESASRLSRRARRAPTPPPRRSG